MVAPPTKIQTKLLILLLMLAVGVTLYMYILYKEVRSFEKEILDIKKAINRLSALAPQANIEVIAQSTPMVESLQVVPVPPTAGAVGDTPGVYENDDDDDDEDDVSVTSNEIKNILTNIQDDDDSAVAVPVSPPPAPAQQQSVIASLEPSAASPTPTPAPAAAPASASAPADEEQDLTKLSDAELSSMKYEELRGFLRRRGIQTRGNKQDFINAIIRQRQN